MINPSEFLSIVVPMFNEQENILNTYESINGELERLGIKDSEIIFVNDGSTDDSWSIAKELEKVKANLTVIGYDENQGRGKALREGIVRAKGEIIITLDFDLSYDVSHISKMLTALDNNKSVDVILVSCYMPGGKTIGIPPFRLFVSKVANLLYRFAYDPPVYTSTCVVRAYRKNAVKNLYLTSDDKEIHLEILSKVLANNFKVLEIPGVLQKRKKGKSKFKFRSQSIAHIVYFIQEKPFTIFGILGFLLIVIGILSTTILLYTRFGGDPEFNATYISKLISPNFIIILCLSGLQMLGIGFLGIQNNLLKRELFRIQNMIKKYHE